MAQDVAARIEAAHAAVRNAPAAVHQWHAARIAEIESRVTAMRSDKRFERWSVDGLRQRAVREYEDKHGSLREGLKHVAQALHRAVTAQAQAALAAGERTVRERRRVQKPIPPIPRNGRVLSQTSTDTALQLAVLHELRIGNALRLDELDRPAIAELSVNEAADELESAIAEMQQLRKTLEPIDAYLHDEAMSTPTWARTSSRTPPEGFDGYDALAEHLFDLQRRASLLQERLERPIPMDPAHPTFGPSPAESYRRDRVKRIGDLLLSDADRKTETEVGRAAATLRDDMNRFAGPLSQVGLMAKDGKLVGGDIALGPAEVA